MKAKLYAAAVIALALASAAHAGGAHDHSPKHGGVVTEAKDMDYELVAKPAAIQLHLRDHGKPVDVSKASAKLTLLSGTEKQEVEPAGRRQAGGHGQLQGGPWHQGGRHRHDRRQAVRNRAVCAEVGRART